MKSLSHFNKKHLSWLLLIPLLLACTLFANTPELPTPDLTPILISPSSMPPPDPPTEEATAVPETSQPPEEEATPVPPTAEPKPGGPAVLPAALYFLNTANQIMRLAPDGLTLTQITNEPQPVIDFDVFPADGRLVYVSGNNLIESDADGSNPFVKIAGESFDPDQPGESITKAISSPRYSPDGSQIAFGLNGVNLMASGEATDYQVIVPSDPYPDVNNPGANTDETIRFFTSGDWSPNGAKLAVSFSFFPEAGGMALKNLEDGTYIELENPIPGIVCCDWAWSADSSVGYLASDLLAYGLPGLVRFDTATGQGTTIIAGLPSEDSESDPESSVRLFKSVFLTGDGSLLSFVDAPPGFTEQPLYTMHQIAPDGSSLTPLRTDNHPIWEVLWADDGSGAIIVDTQFNPQFPPTGPMRWLPSDGGPVLNLPANGSHARWGGSAVTLPTADSPTEADFANLETLALADFGFELSEDGINDLHHGRFNLGDGRSLWFIHTVGLRDFNLQNHSVGLYAFEDGRWQRLAVYIMPDFDDTDGIPGPDYMNIGSVQQVFIEPTNGWLSVEGGIGAHGGTLHILRFDGQSLTLEAQNSNGSPVAGRIEDINGDGRQEVLLDLSDFYIFSYAAGVRLINYNMLRWDGSDLVPVTLARLENTTTATDLNNQAINLTEAELWQDARQIINQAHSQAPDNETISWNAAFINTIADARENANSSFPIMDRVFFGDYNAVIDILRNYSAAEIFSLESPIIVGTSAEGSEELMAQHIHDLTTSALTLNPDLASAHFLRGWAAYLLNPNDPTALADVQQAAVLAPDEELYANAVTHLQQ
jgi:hypothetical protein